MIFPQYYCKTPATIEVCPAGYFCKAGIIEGLPCGTKGDCPEGSEYSSRTDSIILIIVVCIVLYFIFLFKYFIEEKVKESKDTALMLTKEGRLVEVSELSEGAIGLLTGSTIVRRSETFDVEQHSQQPHQPSYVGNDDTTFTIRFEDIGCTLPTGVQIMKGVSGSFLPKRMCAIMGPSGAG
jgi:ABC-type multidrug transport system fused ATPase/permease subunit